MVTTSPERQRNALIFAWFSVGNGILLVVAVGWFTRALALLWPDWQNTLVII